MQDQYAQATEQLLSLKEYLKEYSTFSLKQSLPVTPVQLQSKQCFADKLHQAIEAQTQEIKQLAEIVEKGREEWLEKKIRKESLQALFKKLKQAHQSRLDKREQRMLDELAAQSMVAKQRNRE